MDCETHVDHGDILRSRAWVIRSVREVPIRVICAHVLPQVIVHLPPLCPGEHKAVIRANRQRQNAFSNGIVEKFASAQRGKRAPLIQYASFQMLTMKIFFLCILECIGLLFKMFLLLIIQFSHLKPHINSNAI